MGEPRRRRCGLACRTRGLSRNWLRGQRYHRTKGRRRGLPSRRQPARGPPGARSGITATGKWALASSTTRIQRRGGPMVFAGKDITRRELLRGAAAGMIGLATRAGVGGARPSARPPNIVFILADDLGYADVSCYGRPDFSTPNIDHITAQGLRFLQAYANSAVCTATRTALITGRYQYRLRLGLEEPLRGNLDVGLPPEHSTLPSLLKKAGYATTLIGKWHLGFLPKFGPLKSGYDQFFGILGCCADYFTHTIGGKDDLWDDDVAIYQVGYLTGLLGSRAVDVVNGYAKSGQPFLLSLHFNAPHWPWEAPGDEAESERLRQAGSGGLADFDGGSQKTYQRMIEEMDKQIGRVLYHHHFHQRQWRRALCRYLAFHRQENGIVGRGFADSGLDLMACTHPEGPDNRPSLHQHGLDADVARRRWHRAPSLLPRRWHESLADPDSECASGPSQAVLALQGERAAGSTRRRLQIPQNPGQYFPLQRCGGPARTRQPEGPPKGRLSAARPRVVRVESFDAFGDQGELHRQFRWPAACRPLRRQEIGSAAGHPDLAR